ncbi:hypothetical protein L6452_17651 [Arctium lappa]|uniref:Uncharacterized protein n=1 Tax=Arctium lappa TaxID=4217 RepID=A0ACB9C461_ARCLA|nr:hypothetical protein L6452_17651 [Arctium lappa]
MLSFSAVVFIERKCVLQLYIKPSVELNPSSVRSVYNRKRVHQTTTDLPFSPSIFNRGNLRAFDLGFRPNCVSNCISFVLFSSLDSLDLCLIIYL